MNYAPFRKGLDAIADKLSENTPWHRHVYSKVIGILLEFLEVNGIPISDTGLLRMDKKTVLLLYGKVHTNRSHQIRQRCKCLNWLLDTLRIDKRYEGFFLNVPEHIPRKLVFDLSSVPFADLKKVEFIENSLPLSKNCLQNGKPLSKSGRGAGKPSAFAKNRALKRKEHDFFCSFLASAIISGALSRRFVNRILNVKFAELTFVPFTMKCFHSGDDIREREGDGLSFFRYWLPPVVALYFLRLILFLHTQRLNLGLEFEDDYVFPKSYREGEFKKRLQDTTFHRWVDSAIPPNIEFKNSFCIGDLRTLSAYKLSDKVPCFLLSAMINTIPCDSLEKGDLHCVDQVLDKATEIVAPNGRTAEEPAAHHSRRGVRADIKKIRVGLRKNETFSTFLDKIHHIRRRALPLAADKEKEKLEAAEKIEKAVSETFGDDNEQLEPALLNLKCYALWLAFRLKIPHLSVDANNFYADPIESKFLYILYDNYDKALPSMDSEELVSAIVKMYEGYYGDDIRRQLRTFTNDLYDHQDSIFPKMNWSKPRWTSDRRLDKPNIKTQKPLITFQQVTDMLQLATDQLTEPDRGEIRVSIILAFFAGLRISEVLYLKKQSLIYDDGYVLCIKRSKTKAGERNIPLSLLLPDAYLSEVVTFFKNANAKASPAGANSRLANCIMLEEDPEKEIKIFSKKVAKVIKDSNPEATFHHFRHSFINWFLIRWYVAVYGAKHEMLQGADFLSKEVFSDISLDNLKKLVFGYGEQKEHQRLFSHAVSVLSRLVGHAGPITTMTSYIHIGDWLCNLFTNDGSKVDEIRLSGTEIKEYLQFTKIPKSFLPKLKKDVSSGNYSIATNVLIKEQVRSLRKKMRIEELGANISSPSANAMECCFPESLS